MPGVVWEWAHSLLAVGHAWAERSCGIPGLATGLPRAVCGQKLWSSHGRACGVGAPTDEASPQRGHSSGARSDAGGLLWISARRCDSRRQHAGHCGGRIPLGVTSIHAWNGHGSPNDRAGKTRAPNACEDPSCRCPDAGRASPSRHVARPPPADRAGRTDASCPMARPSAVDTNARHRFDAGLAVGSRRNYFCSCRRHWCAQAHRQASA